MFKIGDVVVTPKGRGNVLYIEGDYVSIQMKNGNEMDFDIKDLSKEEGEENKITEEVFGVYRVVDNLINMMIYNMWFILEPVKNVETGETLIDTTDEAYTKMLNDPMFESVINVVKMACDHICRIDPRVSFFFEWDKQDDYGKVRLLATLIGNKPIRLIEKYKERKSSLLMHMLLSLGKAIPK